MQMRQMEQKLPETLTLKVERGEVFTVNSYTSHGKTENLGNDD